MKIEKLPSGSYRVRMTFNGKRYSVVFDHKPTEAEAMLKFSDKVKTVIDCEHVTFEFAAKEYCKLKKDVISPTTYRSYAAFTKNMSDGFLALYVDEITSIQLQQEINYLSKDKKPKTVKNYYNFIISAIKMYRDGFSPKVKLPEGEKTTTYIPTDKEVKLLLEYAKTESKGRFYVPIVLGCYGMRRSEICAITSNDIKDNIIHITKAKVMTSDMEWIIKNYPKNETSIRDIPVPEDIVEMIKENGCAYDGHPNTISDFINRFCNKYDVQHFSLHKLRHYFCSRLFSENIDVKTIISLSGHKTDHVMKTVYLHTIDEKKQEASDKLNNILFK